MKRHPPASSPEPAPDSVVPGSVLVHGHVFVDIPESAEAWTPGRYDSDEAYRAARPKLEALKPYGCVRFLECTSVFMGRDPRLMRRLSDDTGIDIWICSGLRGTGGHRHIPKYAFEENAEQLARRWIDEITSGVDGVKARFIKLGIDGGRHGATGGHLVEIDRKLITAAAIAGRETGVTTVCHSGDSGHARITMEEELDTVLEAGLPPRQFVVVHAQHEDDFALHERIARAGFWVEFDGVPRMVDWSVDAVTHLAGKGLLDRVLVSEDKIICDARSLGKPINPGFRPYTTIYEQFLPKLDPAWRKQLMVKNPRTAFGG